MSTETEIQTEVDSLKTRFPDTKALYREVCALLFFRHGIIPTASKLYQFVRKGSMSAPADALNKFWEDLRSKARVEIDHPDLPPAIKDAAATAIAALWSQASAAAREELRVVRDDASAELVAAKADLQAAHGRQVTLQEEIELVRSQLAAANAAAELIRAELEAERRGHAATAARNQELQRQTSELHGTHEATRQAFTEELEKARTAVSGAADRAAAAERRALLEVDDQRQARKAAEQQLEQQRAIATQAAAKAQERALADAEEAGRLRGQLGTLEQANRNLSDAHAAIESQLNALRGELSEAQQDRIRYRTEAETAMAMLERLSPAAAPDTPPARAAKPRRPSKN